MRAKGWQVVKTRAYEVMTFTLRSVQTDSLTAAVIGGRRERQDRGNKRTTRRQGATCITWSAPSIGTGARSLAKLLQNMGATVAGTTVSDMMDNIVDTLKRKESPLIVLDEADKLSDQVLYFS